MSKKPKIEQIFWKLAHFKPLITDDFGNQILDYLVLDALSTFGVLLSPDPKEIKNYIKELFLVDFEESEIIDAARRLEKKEYIEIIEADTKWDFPKFKIKAEISQKITENVNSVREIEEIVFEDWKQELIKKYKSHPTVSKKINEIIDCFKDFLSIIFHRHGIECINLLYPNNSKANKWIERVKGSIIDELKEKNRTIKSVIRIEIPIFFQKQDENRKLYLFQLLNSSFFWHLIQIDENCSELFKEVIRGQKLFIDNNILYHLVGINGKNILTSTHNILKFAKELGYELWVTSKTLEEFNESLIWNMKEYKRNIPVPIELAEMAVECLGEQSFLTSYWKEFVSTGLTIEEFVAEKSNIDELINGLGINVTDEFKEEIEKSKELKHEESILRGVTDFPLNPNVVEHDAFHKILISKVRNGSKYHFQDAVAWFLTSDSKLPTYDRVSRKGKSCLPFCITTNQWIQVNRPLLSRTSETKELEESFHVLVTLPFIRAMTSSLDLDSAYQDVLGKLAKFERMNPQLAFQIIADSHFMYSISQEDKNDVPLEKLENKFVDIASQMRVTNEEIEKELAKVQGNNLEETQGLHNQINGLTKDTKEIKENLHKREEERDYYKKKVELLRRVINWGICLIIVIPLSLLLWISNFIHEIFPFLSEAQLIIVNVLAQIILIAILLLIPLLKHWKFLIGTILFGSILEIFQILTSVHK